jgi:hypothetical protein
VRVRPPVPRGHQDAFLALARLAHLRGAL